MSRKYLLLTTALSILLFHSHAYSQQNKPIKKRDGVDPSSQDLTKKFAQLQEMIRDGKVQFIGQKPTFSIKPNPVLAYPIRSVTGDVIPKNIEQIAREQQKISTAILSLEQEYIDAAVSSGSLKKPTLPKCADRVRFDWRSSGRVTPIKSQGACGSCTTFATNGAFEGNSAVRNNLMLDSSEQHLLSCSAGVSCRGGNRAVLAQYMVDTGTSTEASYPYSATDSACNGAISTPHDAIAWGYVSDEAPTVSELKNALCRFGPVAIGILATPTFQAYSRGIFNETVSVIASNHAMTLVGWNDRDGGYWIVKNSWDTTWGENGYGRVAWGSNNVGRWANWIQAPLRALKIRPEKWRQILRDRKIPLRNKYIARR